MPIPLGDSPQAGLARQVCDGKGHPGRLGGKVSGLEGKQQRTVGEKRVAGLRIPTIVFGSANPGTPIHRRWEKMKQGWGQRVAMTRMVEVASRLVPGSGVPVLRTASLSPQPCVP